MGALHDRASRQGYVFSASLAAQDTGTRNEAERLARGFAVRAAETIRPFCAFKVASAGRIIRKQLLELREGLGEGQFFPFVNVVCHDFLG